MVNAGRLHRLGLFLLFLICGLSLPTPGGTLVFPFSSVFSDPGVTYRVALSAVFLSCAVVLFRSERFRKYWHVLFAFFVASFALLMDLLAGSLLNLQASTMDGIAATMVSSTVAIVVPVVVLTWVTGGSMPSIYLKKGKLKLGLVIGLAGFLFFAADLGQAATWLFQGQNLSLQRVLPWTPWILTLVLANGVREEVLYRGLFLRKYERLLVSDTSNLLQGLIFGLSHTAATYSLSSMAMFASITILLGLAFGYVAQRTDSLIGSILFHAGADVPLIVAVFSNL